MAILDGYSKPKPPPLPWPPRFIMPEIFLLGTEISEKVGMLTATLPNTPIRRPDCLARRVQASLQIAGNAMTLDQVTEIMNGHQIIGPSPQEIQEVRNALEAYEKITTWDPYRLDDLLAAHAVLMEGMEEPGKFRSAEVGVYHGKNLNHAAPEVSMVPFLMKALFDKINEQTEHPIIASCYFHYCFELCHPFLDGNGRLGRLWQTLLLMRWRPVFVNVPVEVIVRDRQADYFAAFIASEHAEDPGYFIVFMLTAIRNALTEAASTVAEHKGSQKTVPTAAQKSSQKSHPGSSQKSVSDGSQTTKKTVANDSQKSSQILNLLRKDSKITIAGLSDRLGLSGRTIKNHLDKLKKQGHIRRIGSDRGGHWEVNVK